MNVKLEELKIKERLSLGDLKLANVTVNGGGYERGYEAGFAQGLISGPFQKSSGEFVTYGAFKIAHGLPKAPKLVICFRKDYKTLHDVNKEIGFIYTEHLWVTWRQHSMYNTNFEQTSYGIPNMTVPYQPKDITVDDTYVNVAFGISTECFWEAYTW